MVVSRLIFRPPVTTNPDLTSVFSLPVGAETCSYLHLQPSQPSSTYLLFSHGNASTIFTLRSYFQQLVDTYHIHVVSYDYPGYGLSTGSPSEAGCYRFHEAMIAHLQAQGVTDLHLVGRSLGTGVVINYVSTHPWTRPIVLISPYRSIITTWLPWWRWTDYFTSWRKLETITCPVTIWHGTDDTVVPVGHGEDLFLQWRNNPTLNVVEADHRNILGLVTYQLGNDLL